MRVESSQLSFEARRHCAERREILDRIRVELRPSQPVVSTETVPIQNGGDYFEPGDPRLLYAWLVIEALLGGKIPSISAALYRSITAQTFAQAAAAQTQWSVTVDHREIYEENESLVVKAAGSIQTSDGRSITFDAEFALARSFRVETASTFRAGNAPVSDPLFLDTDRGLLLLVRDFDADGEVTGIGELFGARNGDGFSELAAFDADRNGWIDSGDPVFGELHLRLADGGLSPIAELGIGALSTGYAAGTFEVKDHANEIVAIVRRTGVYLSEEGVPGALRQIDLAI